MAKCRIWFYVEAKNDLGRSWQDLIAHNQTSIHALTSGFRTLWG